MMFVVHCSGGVRDVKTSTQNLWMTSNITLPPLWRASDVITWSLSGQLGPNPSRPNTNSAQNQLGPHFEPTRPKTKSAQNQLGPFFLLSSPFFFFLFFSLFSSFFSFLFFSFLFFSFFSSFWRLSLEVVAYTVKKKKKIRKIRASNLPTNYCKIYHKSTVNLL